jgi:hypothetical protein
MLRFTAVSLANKISPQQAAYQQFFASKFTPKSRASANKQISRIAKEWQKLKAAK